MTVSRSVTIAILVMLVILLCLAVVDRRMLYLRVLQLQLDGTALSAMYTEKDGVQWYDDYFTIEYIDADTIAIGEPRYWQANYNYLILGARRAILFDSGPGVRDIAPVVKSLTTLPVTVVASHLHFDHLGNHEKFAHSALLDLPQLRAMAYQGVMQLTDKLHLGFLEQVAAPKLRISEWWQDGSLLDLGGRKLRVIHAPGHTPDSMVLYDADRRQLFSGDFIYPGPLYAFLPGSDLGDYLETTRSLVALLEEDSVLLTAHRMEAPGAPLLQYRDLEQLQLLLEAIKAGTAQGEGVFPRRYAVNDQIQLLTDFPWFDRM